MDYKPNLPDGTYIGASAEREEVAYDKHYKFTYKGHKLDPYRIILIYKITHPAHQHAIKKLLRAGNSVKELERDIDEVIMTLNRWKEMIKEDE